MMEYCRKRLLPLLLALFMVLELSPRTVAVGEGRLTIEGREVKLPSSGGVTYEYTDMEDSRWWLSCMDGEYTLTLINAEFKEGIVSTLNSLVICVPEGTYSTIFSSGNCINAGGSLRITGGGSLSVSSNATESYVTVYAADSLAVSGAKLDVNGRSSTGVWGGAVSIVDSAVTVNVSYGGSAECAGIFGGRLSVSGSDVAVSVSGEAVARAIYSGSGLTISDSDVVANASAASGGVGIAVQNGLSISGGAVSASASSKSVCAVGIDSWSKSLSLTVARGSITAEGFCTDAARSYAYGIRTHLLYAAGGTITASGTDGGIAAGSSKSDGITLGDSVGIYEGGSIIPADNGSNYFKTFAKDKSSLSFLDSGYVTGGASPVVLKSALSALAITGEPRVGKLLTAALTPAGADAEYSWYRSDTISNTAGTAIQNATGASYTLSGDDLGKYVYCRASGTGGFEGSVVSGCTGRIEPSKGRPLVSATLSGTAQAGNILTAAVEPAGASASYRWFRSGGPDEEGSAIEGAESKEYALTAQDVGMYVYCAAYGSGDYTGAVYSAAAGAVEAAPEEEVPTLVYVPLDNRTVNVDRVVYEAESAGFRVVMPDEDLYATRLDGQPRNSNGTGFGDGKALLAWIQKMDANADYFVLSLDQLLSGGLVNSRVMYNTDLSEEYAIIDALVELSKNNHVYIADTVARLATCTVGYKGGDTEDYSYLRSYNIQVRAPLSGGQLTVDNIIAGYAKDEKGRKLAVKSNYAELVRRTLLVRERKLRLIDYILDQDSQGEMTYFIGVDDSNSRPTVQTNEISYIRNALGGRGTIYSGTDELGMMAVLRLMIDYYGSSVKAKAVYFGGTEDSASGSAYDIETIRENVKQHLDSVGVEMTDGKDADLEIVVLTSPAKSTMNVKYITQMLDYINGNIASGVPTIVINPVPDTYGNNFEYRMIRECETSMFLAYSSWGTVGNAIGLAVGNGVSRYLYLQSRSESSDEADDAFLKGLVFSLEKDISYIRGGGKSLFTEYLAARGWRTDNFYVNEKQALQVASDLERLLKNSEYNVTVNDILANLRSRRYLKGLHGECGVIGGIELSNYSAPFCRTNEIRFDIRIGLSDITINGFGGNVTVTLPYTPAEGEVVYGLSVYYQDKSGTVRKIPCEYDPLRGCVVFTVSDLSGIFLSSNEL